jgi:hypothetical protein
MCKTKTCNGGKNCAVYKVCASDLGEGSPEFLKLMLKHGKFHPSSKYAYLNSLAGRTDWQNVDLPPKPTHARRSNKQCPRRDRCAFKDTPYGCKGGRLCERTLSYAAGLKVSELAASFIGPVAKRTRFGFYDAVWNPAAVKAKSAKELQAESAAEEKRIRKSLDKGLSLADEEMQNDRWKLMNLIARRPGPGGSSSSSHPPA